MHTKTNIFYIYLFRSSLTVSLMTEIFWYCWENMVVMIGSFRIQHAIFRNNFHSKNIYVRIYLATIHYEKPHESTWICMRARSLFEDKQIQYRGGDRCVRVWTHIGSSRYTNSMFML